MAENLHGWARGAFRPGKLSGTPLPVMRRTELARRASGASTAGAGLGVLAVWGLGIFGAAVGVGLLIGWWRKRQRERAQAA